MKKTLERIYIAVDLQGNEVVIEDIAEYILHYGVNNFLSSFGFDFGKLTKVELRTRKNLDYFDWDNYASNYYFKTVVESEFKYRIKDYFGKYYCPKFIVSVLLEHYEVEESYKYRWSGIDFGYKSYTKRYRRSKYKTIKFNKGFWQANENSKDYGVKKVRNLKDYFLVPFDDCWHRDEHKNWKKYRKTQYKIKKS